MWVNNDCAEKHTDKHDDTERRGARPAGAQASNVVRAEREGADATQQPPQPTLPRTNHGDLEDSPALAGGIAAGGRTDRRVPCQI